jgi:hypothetical protein
VELGQEQRLCWRGLLQHRELALLLVPPQQETLTSNYEGTRTVLELAASTQCLRGLVHVSSAYVNMNVPRGSTIDEAIYPLRLGRQVVDVEQIAKVGCTNSCSSVAARLVVGSLPGCLVQHTACARQHRLEQARFAHCAQWIWPP